MHQSVEHHTMTSSPLPCEENTPKTPKKTALHGIIKGLPGGGEPESRRVFCWERKLRSKHILYHICYMLFLLHLSTTTQRWLKLKMLKKLDPRIADVAATQLRTWFESFAIWLSVIIHIFIDHHWSSHHPDMEVQKLQSPYAKRGCNLKLPLPVSLSHLAPPQKKKRRLGLRAADASSETPTKMVLLLGKVSK